MSLSAKSATRTKSAIRNRYIQSEAEQEIQDFLEGCYGIDVEPLLSEEEIKTRILCRWMRNRLDVMNTIGLSTPNQEGVELDYSYRISFDGQGFRYVAKSAYFDGEVSLKTKLFPHSLLNIGVDTPAKGNRFVDFYLKVYDSRRSWVSGCQVNQQRVAAIAVTPNYNRLPDWVRQALMDAPESAKIGGDRVGNIWRLIPCVKAWKWCNRLPKGIAEKVGKLSPKMRMLAAWAWENRQTHDGDYNSLPRKEVELSFWENLKALESMPLVSQLNWMWSDDTRSYLSPHWGKSRWAAFLTESLGLPWGLVELPSKVSHESIEDAIAQYATPEIACQTLFGCGGKATTKAFKSSDKNYWQWAKALGESNPDAVQKILQLENCIAFQSDAIDFLKSLPMQSRIRLLSATTFKYRGVTQPISDDHVRDTGYLWKNIQQKPELGRIRCWFSVHEQLSTAFVKELPDEALPIPAGWERVDGLCAVDGSWQIELPKRVATLKYYGECLRNCVGGYGNAIKSGRSVIFAVRERGILTHCVEVCDSWINQFYRSGNSSADWKIRNSVEDALLQAKLIDSSKDRSYENNPEY